MVLKSEVMKQRCFFFSLFIGQHWIAGVLRHDNFENEIPLAIHGPAPSVCLNRGVDQIFQEERIESVQKEEWYSRQLRVSQDYRIYMAVMLFAIHTKT